MARTRKYRYFSCDFETTVYKGQTFTEVWASAVVELYTEDVKIFHSIDETLSYFKSLRSNIIAYYHNLKFDGTFWVNYFLDKLQLKQATEKTGSEVYDITFKDDKHMENNTFKYSITDKGRWFTVVVKLNDYIIEFRDSLKLLPFSVKEIGKSFQTKHKKLDMEYTGFRYAGCNISDKEKEYIANDVLVVKEALEIMFDEGHNKLTIGSCCLGEYKAIVGKAFFEEYLPDLTEVWINKKQHTYTNADQWIRKTYKGGWCYLVKGKENKIYENGITADVNSLYPSVMHSESGNRYPVGLPQFWTGNYIPEEAQTNDRYFFVRVKTRFYIKDGYLPFIQIKGNMLYKPTEVLGSSDIFNKKTGSYSDKYYDFEGNLHDTRVELSFTMTEYKLFLEHYEQVDFEIIDGCYFETQIGIFDEYIDKYKQIKMTNKGAKRTLAKLFLNNLYGKMASSTDSSFKYCYLKDDKSIGYVGVSEANKKAGYIAIGSAITGYARDFTIRHAQVNYNGLDRGFIYADTDSIHCDLKAYELKGLTVHPTNFCSWALESTWDKAIFVRQKTYIEHVVEEDLQPIENPYYNVKCAGMPDRCKEVFIRNLEGEKPNKDDTEETRKFLKEKRTLKDFKVGLKIHGKLTPKRIKGGTLLVDGWYEIRK